MRQQEAELVAALSALGLTAPENANAKPEAVEIGGAVYWLNKDGRGGLWINGREKREDEDAEAGAPEGADADVTPSTTAAAEAGVAGADSASSDQVGAASAPEMTTEDERQSEADEADITREPLAPIRLQPGENLLSALRPALKASRRGSGASGAVEDLARALNQPVVELLEGLVRAGLTVPDDSREKVVTVELGEELVWLSRSAKDDSLVLNAKGKSAPRRRAGGRSRKKAESGETEGVEVEARESGEADEPEFPVDSVDAADPRPAESYSPEESKETSERP